MNAFTAKRISILKSDIKTLSTLKRELKRENYRVTRVDALLNIRKKELAALNEVC